MRCSACAASRARGLYLGLAVALTTTVVVPFAWGRFAGGSPAAPAWWHTLGALGPTLAAWYVARREDGAEGVQDWRERVLDWHVGVGWWLAALAMPLGALALAVTIVRGWTGDASAAWQGAALAERLASPRWITDTLVLGALASGVFQEPGWRGWLYPHLRMTHGPLAATLLLWPMWAVWHAPFLLYRMPLTPGALAGVAFGLLCGAIVLSWLVEETGSAAPGMLFHASSNVAVLVAGVAAPSSLVALPLLLAVVAAGIVVRWWLVPRRAAVDFADRARAFAGHPTAVLR
ncbi:MAG: CPBP family intramembrane glutamic endopeptidase [Gemmatimonadota bacterium]